MISFDTITRLIVGRAAADRSEYRRLERMYEGAEAKLKLITEVTRGSTRSTESIYGSSACSNDIRARGQEILKETVDELALKRIQSAPTVAKFTTSASLDDLKRTHSDSCIEIPSAPLPEMTGFGKYRRAVNASASWQLKQLEQHLKNDGDIIADFLGDHPPMGLDPSVWHQYRTTRVQKIKESRSAASSIYRSSLAISSNNTSAAPSPATSSIAPSSQYTDPLTGTKIVRGFNMSQSITTSRPTSAASSAKKSCKATHVRQSSVLCPSSRIKDKTTAKAALEVVKTQPRSALSSVQRSSGNSSASYDSGCAIESDDDSDAWMDED